MRGRSNGSKVWEEVGEKIYDGHWNLKHFYGTLDVGQRTLTGPIGISIGEENVCHFLKPKQRYKIEMFKRRLTSLWIVMYISQNLIIVEVTV